jgi:hypothetical protein
VSAGSSQANGPKSGAVPVTAGKAWWRWCVCAGVRGVVVSADWSGREAMRGGGEEGEEDKARKRAPIVHTDPTQTLLKVRLKVWCQ